VTTQVIPTGMQTCFTMSAIVMSTDVQDSDADGLLYIW